MKNDKQAQVFHFDVFGKRQEKYHFLENNSIHSVDWKKLELKEPNYFFTIKDFASAEQYERGFKVDEIFKVFSNGFTTERDNITIHITKESLLALLDNFKFLEEEELRSLYNIGKDGSDWKIKTAKAEVVENKGKVVKALYRPFDIRMTYYTGKSKGFYSRPRGEVLINLVHKQNLGLIIPKQNDVLTGSFITNIIAGHKSFSAYNKNSIFPLYQYSLESYQQTLEKKPERSPNLNQEIVNKIAKKLNLSFVPEKEPEGKVCYINNPEVRAEFRTTFAPIDLLDYIYAVLHSPGYREKYKEFLKIDFPRVPYPKDAETFWRLVKLGGALRQLHLLESHKITDFKTTYPKDGDNIVTRKMTKTSPGWELGNPEKTVGRVWINDEQFFDNVPLIAWEFYIGGYQPAQKWLKDRYGRKLTFEDIIHYQKIIIALTETDRLMKEIDEVGVE